jgi:hypothetical protein
MPFPPSGNSRTIVSALLALVISLSASAQFSDSFSDGNFTDNPIWTGQTGLYIVNPAQQLQLNDVAAGSAALSTSFASASLDNREWQIWVRQTFAGSDNNQSRIYLTANGAPGNYTGAATAGVQGYFLKLGEGGSADAIKFCRDNGSGNIVELAAGTPSLIAGSFTIRIKVIRNGAGLWTISAAPDGDDNFQFETQVTDLTYTTTSHFGVVCLYTSSNADNFFFDDIYFGDIIVDTTAPTVTSVTATSETTVNVQFSESVAAATATDNSSYLLNGTTNPVSAVPAGPSLITLTFASAFPANITQQLEVSSVTDLSGNAMVSSTHPFTWFIISPGAFRDVVFNEVLADPSPVVGLPEAEYVELHNPTTESFNLQNWKYINSTTSTTLPDYTLGPGEYVILCDDDNAAFFSPSPVIGLPSFTALTNTGDSLTLRNAADDIIDILVYSISWYDSPEKDDGGWSLEQVNPEFPCGGSANWKESVNASGGTPGAVNSVFNNNPDVTAPTVISVLVNSPQSITIVFSETMSQDIQGSLSMIPFFTFSGLNWNNDLTQLSATVTPAIDPGIPYELEISGWSDCSGNIMTDATSDVIIGFTPTPGDILINEIMADPDPQVAGPAAEYIELYNTSDQLIDLKGCMINEEPFTLQTLIQPGGYLIIADLDNAFSFIPYPDAVFLPGFPGLTNSGLELVLQDPEGAILDEVNYDITWYNNSSKDDGGWSLELINPEDPCSDRSNWTASVDPRGMTAGEQNSVYDITPDTQAPQFVLLLNEPFGSVTLRFNEPLESGSISSLEWSINGEVQSNAGVLIPDDELSSVILPLPSNLQPGIVYTIAASGLTDCWGNAMNPITASFALPEAAQAGDLLINEILFNPNTPGQDFVEIVNHSPRAISLQGWRLANEENGAPNDPEDISESAVVLLPGQYLVLTEAGHSLETWYPFTRSDRIWIMENVPTFNVGDGTCYLLMPDGEVSDVMRYTEDMHYPLLDDVKGVSLERIDFNRPSDDLTNWASAAESQGFATPGYVNSQSFSTGIGEDDITLDPMVFSPDNDGYQDNLVISYRMPEPGLVGNITIFTSDGVRVRRLMRNELLGTEGQISWNGFGDQGEKLAIGVYLVYFETFSETGQVSRIKKSCVLAHPLGSN